MKEKETFSPENEEMNINADADIPGNTHLSNPDGEDAMEKIQAELEEQKDKYLRLFAEFDNFKRRSAKERIELIQTAGKDVIISMLGVMDDCDRAEKQLNESNDIATQKEGIQLVFNKLRSTLQSKGLTAMERPFVNITSLASSTPFTASQKRMVLSLPAETKIPLASQRTCRT